MSRYRDAGVDVNAGYELVTRIKNEVASTKQPGVLGGLGSFGGLFDLGELNIKHPILVSGTDGVGTKLLIAQGADKHETIGIDCVAMCVNDIVAQGAKPLFFLDYIATGHNNPEKMAAIVKGIASGCRQAKVALIGGETAEMPDMYSPEEYDLAGYSTGVVEKSQLLTNEKPQAGDILIGLPSSGLHSNGFSLVRQILFKDNDFELSDKPAMFNGMSLGEVLLEPTRIYVKSLLPLLEAAIVNGISHITGGGLIENLPRMFNERLQAQIRRDSWPILPIFEYLKEQGNLSDEDCFEAFNMGLGMIVAVSPANLEKAKSILASEKEKFYIIGELAARPDNSEKISFK
ncbi:phosphoribosylformylglycinamidine cyclo-ligase [Liquorilactobacillus mali]|uniref:Phosphoribosylformylglycinamidine cyclo-ligase n=1 Tax=Liquorilactobacillus mali KCTC 3596 = DSM 20444 TaxID=1046596 RepID=J0L0C9_9LACO|nr:phosphoribosylformylglycinamidine cyclo-ligase [Liquorilactobacillus mali]EJF00730.1 phosphoribosylaminoimidazole synthetase [Liquorilactobacillus mali KCTC 3596 = DSM 20444]KRN11548.1 phosphoribosylaminoimidazole synthetase [Liquorilactobacillus mali KCTC 3596 = DSM 20444]MDV7756792.1 phosphoribosylformylglycinamidine cyclo-ligase [Liquorilactobacillus mali]QFQ74295.1 phosphoribosylformylglycinamidine cyclo-ligase [Liquorilactobacillus mali]